MRLHINDEAKPQTVSKKKDVATVSSATGFRFLGIGEDCETVFQQEAGVSTLSLLSELCRCITQADKIYTE